VNARPSVTCGIDWAERHHSVALVDEQGQLVAKSPISDDVQGFAQLVELLDEPGTVRTTRSPWPSKRHVVSWSPLCVRQGAGVRDQPHGSSPLSGTLDGRTVQERPRRRDGAGQGSIRIGRRSTPAAESVSRLFQTGRGAALGRQRAAAACALVSTAALGAVRCYKLGLIRHLPNPPLPVFDSDTVDASGEAYVLGHAPDGVLGAASAAATAALVVWGGAGRDRPRLVRILAAAKALGDEGGAVLLFVEQLRTHRRLCSWCTAASLAHRGHGRADAPGRPTRVTTAWAAECSW
jgi:uncharacterized membrane protein